jgi:hypothetical protein
MNKLFKIKILELQKENGFVLLFAVLISSMVLSISLGLANVAYKEIKFNAAAKSTNDSFLAADTGAECALFYDKADPTNNAFTGTAGPNINCAGSSITISGAAPTWTFTIPSLATSGNACAKVTVVKTGPSTTITSSGYNTGSPACVPGASTIERQLQVSY